MRFAPNCLIGLAAIFVLVSACGPNSSARLLKGNDNEPPCDFKGVSVGDKMSPSQIMSAFGISSNYQMNPKKLSFDENATNISKYGIAAALELEDYSIGPYCDSSSCTIPNGITIGDSDTHTFVYVAISKGFISEIDVSYSPLYWDEVKVMLDHKFGDDWKIEESQITVTDLETKQFSDHINTYLDHIGHGLNKKTGDRCLISAMKIDSMISHKAIGSLHSELMLQRISDNL